MDIPKTFEFSAAEERWYAWWMEKGFFRSTPDDREPYTIVIPPPNVTGVLHMGHMLNNTIQDVLIRRARMMGKNACWVPGTDHASIATEAKVVALLKEKGINKRDLSREEFLKYAWEWKEKYGGIILEQLKKLGASCDWDRTRFTMEEELSESVIDVFIDLHKKGLIYRGTRMVNWDCAALTAVSDEEVEMKETTSKLYYVKYRVEGTENEWVTIATTRPETILGDTAVCVHPDDERYANMKGKKVIVPLVNRSVNIIFDEYVEKEFGTGALKVTPAHDKNDYELGKKHKLDSIDILNPDGTMSAAAQLYVGLDRFACRKQIVKDLEEAGQLVKVEEIKNSIGISERTKSVIEPRLSMQWFLSMKEISKPALDNVLNGNVNLIPDKYLATYKHWMENVHDWCISRQLWWGQQIPAWYDNDANFVVAKTREEAFEKFQTEFAGQNAVTKIEDLRQDEDVVDTWFSSWLWPISVFDPKFFGAEKGYEGNADLQYYYPTNDLVTGPDILFFWIARMIIAGYEYKNEKPFENVYLTGTVRDQLGRKMSKQLGNSPDPLDLIAKYSADGVRVGMLLCSPAGNDLMFDTPLEITPETPLDSKLCEQGRNFVNKIWNAFRLVKGFEVDNSIAQPDASKIAIEWFNEKFNQQLAEIDDLYSKFRLSEALKATYKLVWDDFCAYYLELIKPDFVDGKAKPMDGKTFAATTEFFERILKVVHPFMPFITEELYHRLAERKENEAIIIAPWPVMETFDQGVIDRFDAFMQSVIGVRTIRNEKNISPKEPLELYIRIPENPVSKKLEGAIRKLCNISTVHYTDQKVENASSFMVSGIEFYVPLPNNFDLSAEKEKLKKELEYNKGFLVSVQKKLANEKFVANAKPELIELERRKQQTAETNIKMIEEQLSKL